MKASAESYVVNGLVLSCCCSNSRLDWVGLSKSRSDCGRLMKTPLLGVASPGKVNSLLGTREPLPRPLYDCKRWNASRLPTVNADSPAWVRSSGRPCTLFEVLRDESSVENSSSASGFDHSLITRWGRAVDGRIHTSNSNMCIYYARPGTPPLQLPPL